MIIPSDCIVCRVTLRQTIAFQQPIEIDGVPEIPLSMKTENAMYDLAPGEMIVARWCPSCGIQYHPGESLDY